MCFSTKAKVFWFTGLSGSGKSTLSNLFDSYLRSKEKTVKIIDGDVIRNKLKKANNFSTKSIIQNNYYVLELCQIYMKKYDFILVSVISPFIKTRKVVRNKLGKLYFEIYVKSSIQTVISRDTKGLYTKALNGEIDNMIGISPNVPYEIPLEPDLIINTEKDNESISFNKIILSLKD